MSETVIKIENISKQYRLGLVGTGTIKNDFLRWWKMNILGQEDPFLKIGEKNIRDTKSESGYVWALKDINFEVKRGEVLGIIGKNGAGKSTMLKILSNVTAPTTGTVRAKGRIGSLLEVGTGFHPELTGKENIYLNGSILGMKKWEITKKIDDIIDFSGCARYIDTPVKRYSSGMTVRLGFAVAAFLEPEILIVDEVLAVGDAEFQERAIGKMKAVSEEEGRVVLFVSHNMGSVERLCNRVICFQNGNLGEDSNDVRSVINNYLFSNKTGFAVKYIRTNNAFDNEYLIPLEISIIDENGNNIDGNICASDRVYYVALKFELLDDHPALTIGYSVYTEDGNIVYLTYHTDVEKKNWPIIKKGICKIKSQIPMNLLNKGKYRIELCGGINFKKWLYEPGQINPAVDLIIEGGLSKSPYWVVKRPGVIAPIIHWQNFAD